MPFAEQSKFMVNFTGGLNTEATSLNFPENAAQDIDNFDLFITGEVKRRLGIDFETAYTVRPETTTAANTANYALSTNSWKSVNGKGDVNFLVVQIGTTLYLHDLGAEPLSGTLRGVVNLSASKTGESPEAKALSYAYGEGVLFVGNDDMNTTMIEYDEDTDTFSKTQIVLKIRDFVGVDDGLNTDQRPSSLSNDHKYNLRNQGWPTRIRCARDDQGDDGVINTDPVSWARSQVGEYPSNADIVHACKASAADDARSIGTFSPWVMQTVSTGNTPAPKGHYVLEAFSQNRSSVSGIGVTDNGHTTNRRPSALAFYAGRVWYAGIPDKNYTGNVYFSQQLTDRKNAGKCYQDYDPTAEDLNTLLATDGGVLAVADMGQVYRMEPVGNDLVILAANGVWAVSGDAARGNFQADKFSIRKVTDQGTIARESVVVTEGVLTWWGEGGIWSMRGSQIDDQLVVERITRNTIQSFYDAIPPVSRAYARGFYDAYDKKVYWLYNDAGSYDGINFRFKYNRVLVLDVTLEAFYTYTVSDLATNSPWMCALVNKVPGSETVTQYDIWVVNDDVEEGGDDIVQDVAFESFANVELKILTFLENEDGTYSYTFSEFKDTGFHDWKTHDQARNDISNLGADYNSHIQTGWNNLGDLIRDKTITHLTSFFTRTETGYVGGTEPNTVEFENPSSALVQTRWEFTDADTGRWTVPQQAYRLSRWYIPGGALDDFNYGHTTIRTKLRMRGRGEAFSIRYYSEEGKDMQLLGFAVNVRAGKQP
jgi:hypothetical protein